jgi:hypothetical protein
MLKRKKKKPSLLRRAMKVAGYGVAAGAGAGAVAGYGKIKKIRNNPNIMRPIQGPMPNTGA